MARCMNSQGVPMNSIGGIRGGKCILGKRIKLYEKSNPNSGRGAELTGSQIHEICHRIRPEGFAIKSLAVKSPEFLRFS